MGRRIAVRDHRMLRVDKGKCVTIGMMAAAIIICTAPMSIDILRVVEITKEWHVVLEAK